MRREVGVWWDIFEGFSGLIGEAGRLRDMLRGR